MQTIEEKECFKSDHGENPFFFKKKKKSFILFKSPDYMKDYNR